MRIPFGVLFLILAILVILALKHLAEGIACASINYYTAKGRRRYYRVRRSDADMRDAKRKLALAGVEGIISIGMFLWIIVLLLR